MPQWAVQRRTEHLGVKLQARHSTTNPPAFSNSFLFLGGAGTVFFFVNLKSGLRRQRKKGFLLPEGIKRFSFGYFSFSARKEK
jgi:hypothetical protein